MAGLKVFPVADPQQKWYFLRQRWLKLQQLHGELTPSDLDRPMRYFCERNTLLVLELHFDSIANVVL